MIVLVYHNKNIMNKSIHFTGQPTFSQLIKLLPKEIVASSVADNKSDHYSKYFNTWNHLISMLFCCYGHCDSLREVVSGMRALEGRLYSSGIRQFPAVAHFRTPMLYMIQKSSKISILVLSNIGKDFSRTAGLKRIGFI